MKKICFVTPNVFPVPAVKGGAVETLVEEIINENEKHEKLDIICFSSYDKKAFKESKNYKKTKFIFIKNLNNKVLKFIFKCINHISFKMFNYDIASNRYNKIIYKNICDKELDYIIIEGGNPFEYKNLIKKLKKKKVTLPIYLHIHGLMYGTKELNELYDGFISISEFITNKLVENNEIPKEKVFLVENGIDIKRFSQEISETEKNSLREKYNLKKDDIVIMFLGRLVPEKGIKELILALKNIKNLNKCKLIIVGNSQFANNTKSKFEKQLYELGKQLKENIIFTGFISNKEIYKLHRISDIFVVPSLCEEAFCLSLVEAMASGLPIITTDSGAIPYIVKDECAYILKRDDNLVDNISKTIDILANDFEKRNKMKKIGKILSQKYSLENLYMNFLQILEEE